MRKGQLDENEMQRYLRQRTANAQMGQQAFDARMLAESLKASAV